MAAAIAQAAGPAYVEECERSIKKHGPVKETRNGWTTAGRLRADYVIHAVGPRMKNKEAATATSAHS